MNKLFACITVIMGVLLFGCFAQQNQTDNDVKPADYDTFAKCLTEKGVKFYGASWCPHCTRQKEDFGSSMKYVNYIECATSDGGQAQVCQNAGITAYPTWEFRGGKRMVGEVPFQQLAEESGCQLS